MFFSYYVFAIFVPLVIFYYWSKYKYSYWERRGVRSLPTHWFFGNFKDAFLFRKTASHVMGDIYLQGTDKDDLLGVYIFQKPFLLVRNCEIIKSILIKDFDVFPNRYFGAKTKDLLSKNLFSIDDPEWKYLRTKLSPTFSSGKIKKLFYLMVESSKMMENHLYKQFTNDKVIHSINLKEITMKYISNIIGSVAFGIETNCYEDVEYYEQNKNIGPVDNSIIRSLQRILFFFFPQIGELIDFQLLGRNDKYWRKIFWNSMNDRERSGAKRDDVIDSLLKLKTDVQDENFKFEGDVLLAQSVIFFIAGRESSIVTISYALVELARYPEIQKRVRQEIVDVLKLHHGLTYEAVYEMKYLFQVISETLRLYPPAPFIDRVAVKDYKIPGTEVVVEKGTPVYMILSGIHYDSRFHPNPVHFDPDRFSEERKDDIVPFSYMPFGEGRRTCIAGRVGLLQVAIALITILRNYEVLLTPLCSYEVNKYIVFLSGNPDMKVDLKKL